MPQKSRPHYHSLRPLAEQRRQTSCITTPNIQCASLVSLLLEKCPDTKERENVIVNILYSENYGNYCSCCRKTECNSGRPRVRDRKETRKPVDRESVKRYAVPASSAGRRRSSTDSFMACS